MIPKIDPKEYIFTFETHGSSFVFEDVVVRDYMPSGNSVTLGKDGSVRVYSSHTLLKRFFDEGGTRTAEMTEEVIRKLDAAVEDVNVNVIRLRALKEAMLEDANTVFDKVGLICSLYVYFDPYAWDNAYIKSETSFEQKKNIALVQNYKNKVRAALDPVFFSDDSYFITFLKLISKKGGVSLEDLYWYRKEELLELFEGAKVTQQEIGLRKTAYALVKGPESQITLVVGEQAVDLIASLDATRVSKDSAIKGMVAHGKGKIVKGRVCIVRRTYDSADKTRKEMEDMRQGDILVSESTDPELMAAFHKAAAVVTDTGGLLSHAAITARELDLPCIVGTRVATKVLKTGDMIEVDAGRGIVTIIK